MLLSCLSLLSFDLDLLALVCLLYDWNAWLAAFYFMSGVLVFEELMERKRWKLADLRPWLKAPGSPRFALAVLTGPDAGLRAVWKEEEPIS